MPPTGGIEADRMAQIFQPFELGDASMTRRYGGTGLGLAISTRLADLMGGWVRGASVPGEGATFTLEVPLRVAPPPEVRATEPPAVASRVRSLQILVADDDPSTGRSRSACSSASATGSARSRTGPRSSRPGGAASTT